jgi:hypothetical protein
MMESLLLMLIGFACIVLCPILFAIAGAIGGLITGKVMHEVHPTTIDKEEVRIIARRWTTGFAIGGAIGGLFISSGFTGITGYNSYILGLAIVGFVGGAMGTSGLFRKQNDSQD